MLSQAAPPGAHMGRATEVEGLYAEELVPGMEHDSVSVCCEIRATAQDLFDALQWAPQAECCAGLSKSRCGSRLVSELRVVSGADESG